MFDSWHQCSQVVIKSFTHSLIFKTRTAVNPITYWISSVIQIPKKSPYLWAGRIWNTYFKFRSGELEIQKKLMSGYIVYIEDKGKTLRNLIFLISFVKLKQFWFARFTFDRTSRIHSLSKMLESPLCWKGCRQRFYIQNAKTVINP